MEREAENLQKKETESVMMDDKCLWNRTEISIFMIPAIELISLVIVIIIDFNSSVRTNEIITSYNYLISSNSLFAIFKTTQGYNRKLRWCQPFLHSPHQSINLTSKKL